MQAVDLSAEHAVPPAVLPGRFADPHLVHFGDRYYLYPTTDGQPDWLATSFTAWSSTDLRQWRADGVILDLPRDVRWALTRAWAPCMVARQGRYYFYFSADKNIGVAVGETPVGPFRDPLGGPLIRRGAFPCQVIDPMVFVDDDQQAYLYFGQGRAFVIPLNEDMISYDVGAAREITPVGANEAMFMVKRRSTYYLSWSEFDTRDPRYSVAYGTARSALGPFVRAVGNPILSRKGAVQGTGHHSILQLPGEDAWVMAYHRFAVPGGDGFNREVCLSRLHFGAGGEMLPVEVAGDFRL